MRHQRSAGLLLVVVVLAALAWTLRPDPATSPMQAPAASATVQAEGLPAFLPAEAGPVIRKIQGEERFQHRQDGSVFGNRERRLPAHVHGYYREYTVPTPGLSHRGARRIVTGGDPPREWYYTGDHYESFRQFQPPVQGSVP